MNMKKLIKPNILYRYTNTDNPFGDSKLLDTFVWHKKLEKQGLKDLPVEEKKKLMHLKQHTNREELTKVEIWIA